MSHATLSMSKARRNVEENDENVDESQRITISSPQHLPINFIINIRKTIII